MRTVRFTCRLHRRKHDDGGFCYHRAALTRMFQIESLREESSRTEASALQQAKRMRSEVRCDPALVDVSIMFGTTFRSSNCDQLLLLPMQPMRRWGK